MSSIVKPESGSSLRNRLLKNIAGALRYGAQNAPERDELRDMVAFIILSLAQVQESLQATILAWEKRGYWLKADRFQRDWTWVRQSMDELQSALRQDDVESSLPILAELASNLGTIKPSKKAMGAQLWKGAWKSWKKQNF